MMDFFEIFPQFSKIPGTCPIPTTPTTRIGPPVAAIGNQKNID